MLFLAIKQVPRKMIRVTGTSSCPKFGFGPETLTNHKYSTFITVTLKRLILRFLKL